MANCSDGKNEAFNTFHFAVIRKDKKEKKQMRKDAELRAGGRR